ncbi:MAG: class I mannose-6-phosphate isomerase [Bacteroidaceae bacterium]|nr:class I mannose-6-phosphate isomerase [Bacteroidaceae bacterium]
MYVFKPLLKQTIWGGEAIASFKNVETEKHSIGESWEISAVKDHLSVVTDGADQGKTILELLDEQKEKLVGQKVYAKFGDTFPLLIKFIDARDDLSIQVHPDDATAMLRHGTRGKSEMWYVVSADEGSHIKVGFNQPVRKEDYNRMVEDHSITKVLNEEKVKQGDVFFLPPGRVHSIGAGVFVAEIQETSDITYRIYDYGRKDAEGHERELHTQLAKDVIDYSVQDDYQTHYKGEFDKRVTLVDCPLFTTNLIEPTKTFNADYSGLDSFVVLMCMNGGATITEQGGAEGQQQRNIRQGTTILIPATAQGVVIEPVDNCKMLEVYIKA